MTIPVYPRILPAGDSGMTVEFGDAIDEAINDRVLDFAVRVSALDIPGIIEVVPTYRSATVYFDPLVAEISSLIECLTSLAVNSPSVSSSQGRHLTIPVLYGDEGGPDLADVAAFANRSVDEVVALHSSTEYRCYMLGFSPGFAYLGTVPKAIRMPRLPEPRTHVPAGSVGIADVQTGIYPQASPGGWRLIGRTPRAIYDPTREPPFLIAPGDRVKFVPISRKEFVDLLIC